MADTRTRPPPRPPRSDRSLLTWIALAIPIVFLAGVVAAGVTTDRSDEPAAATATDFALPSTTGEQLSLDDVLAEGDALLYFSMGVGCDGCFLQIPEIDDALAHLNIRLVPIMVDPPDLLAVEAARLGVDDPIYVDADRSVSRAYGMLGQYGHGDVPSHSFALVTQEREVAWVKHYPQMFVPLEDLLADLPPDIP